MEDIEIGNLPAERLKITLNDGDQAEVFQLTDGSMCSRFATPTLCGKFGYFRVHLTVVYLEPKHIEDTVALSGRQAEDALQKLSYLVKALKKQTF